MLKLMMAAMFMMGSASIASAGSSCPYQNAGGLHQKNTNVAPRLADNGNEAKAKPVRRQK